MKILKTIITNPIEYLIHNISKSADDYVVVTEKHIPETGFQTCAAFGNGNNCTMVALYNMMVYCRDEKLYSKIPSDNFELYNLIKRQASALGYTEKKGLSFTKNNSLIRNTWNNELHTAGVKGRTRFYLRKSLPIEKIDTGKPFMFSLACGVYFNHTVTVFGYRVYKNKRTSKEYTFLMIKDGWSSFTRYLPWTNTGTFYLGCMTFLK